jgi:hypothetical protein
MLSCLVKMTIDFDRRFSKYSHGDIASVIPADDDLAFQVQDEDGRGGHFFSLLVLFPPS